MNTRTIQVCTGCLLSVIGAATYVCSQEPFRPAAPKDAPRRATQGFDDEEVANDAGPWGMRGRSLPIAGPARMMGGMTNRPMRKRFVHVNRVVEAPVSDEELQDMKEFQSALQTLKESKGEVARKNATDAMQSLLVKQFEQDLKQRQEELTAIEERVASLRQQLEKRKAFQAEIISLRLKTIVNNADGLGFPDDNDDVQPEVGWFDQVEIRRVEPPRGTGRRGRAGGDEEDFGGGSRGVVK